MFWCHQSIKLFQNLNNEFVSLHPLVPLNRYCTFMTSETESSAYDVLINELTKRSLMKSIVSEQMIFPKLTNNVLINNKKTFRNYLYPNFLNTRISISKLVSNATWILQCFLKVLPSYPFSLLGHLSCIISDPSFCPNLFLNLRISFLFLYTQDSFPFLSYAFLLCEQCPFSILPSLIFTFSISFIFFFRHFWLSFSRLLFFCSPTFTIHLAPSSKNSSRLVIKEARLTDWFSLTHPLRRHWSDPLWLLKAIWVHQVA